MSFLELDGVNTYYGDSHILFDVSLHVEEGERDVVDEKELEGIPPGPRL